MMAIGHKLFVSDISWGFKIIDMEQSMELCFVFPAKGVSFHSSSWEMEGCVDVVTAPGGCKRLLGKVRTQCPLCGVEHVYDVAELACPLSGGDQGDGNTRGGE
jgi:hypothetical protein